MVFPLSLYVVVMTLPRKSSGPRGLAAAWPSADHCCGQRGRPCWKENLPWMDGAQLNKILFLTTSVKQIWHGVVKAQRNTFIDIYSFPVSTDLFFPYLSSLSWDLYVRLTSPYLFSSNSFAVPLFFSLSLSLIFCGIFPSVHLSISFSWRTQRFPLCRFQLVSPQLRQI